MGHFEADGACAWPLPYDDIDLEVLHGGIEDLLDRPVEAVDLIDEEHVPVLEMSEDGRHVTLELQCGSRGGDDAHPHFRGDDIRKGGLAQPGRAGQKYVV